MTKDNTVERTCISCRKKSDKKDFLRMFKDEENSYFFDENMKTQKRGYYICKEYRCLEKLSKNKKYNINSQELLKMADHLKKSTKDYFNILNAMKSSKVLLFGMNMVLENLEKIFFIIITNDINEKNKNKLINRANEYKIPYVFYGNKKKMGEIWGKDEVSVIAINNEKVARGLIN